MAVLLHYKYNVGLHQSRRCSKCEKAAFEKSIWYRNIQRCVCSSVYNFGKTVIIKIVWDKSTKSKMTNRTTGINRMGVCNLIFALAIAMVAMFLGNLPVNMLIRMDRLKKHCEQYHQRHRKIKEDNFLFHSFCLQ